MGRLQTFGNRIRTKDNRLVTGPDDACCCEDAAIPCDSVRLGDLDAWEAQVQVFGGTFSNPGGGSTCVTCTAMHGTRILAFSGAGGPPPPNQTQVNYLYTSATGNPCGITSSWAILAAVTCSGGNMSIVIDITISPGIAVYRYQTSGAEGDFVLGAAWDIPYFSNSGGAGRCTVNTSSFVRITLLPP